MGQQKRLDLYLVEQKLVQSRNKGLQLIKKGKVTVNGKRVYKGGYPVGTTDQVEVLEEFKYVSRGAYKLKGAIEMFELRFAGKSVLDVGSSTGGFTQVALEEGAKFVVAVDVGTGQLHPSLKKHPKVYPFEGVDIRTFSYPTRFDWIVSDVSFISLLKILPSLERLAGGELLLLFKPQFEVGIEIKRNRRGVVTDQSAIKRARERFERETARLSWKLLHTAPSPIPGKKGNREYFYHFKIGKGKKLPGVI